MANLFGRKISVEFGIPNTVGFNITDLRIKFDIGKNLKSNPNTSKISIYNMNFDQRGLLQNINVIITLRVGYEEIEPFIIFKGNVIKSESKQVGPDIITNIQAGDGDRELTNATIDKSYKAGTSISTIINDTLKTFKEAGELIIKEFKPAVDKTNKTGMTISGLSKKIMDFLLGNVEHEWSVQDGETQVLEINKTTDDEGILLTPSTGLVGKPILREKGIQFQSLIVSPLIRAGRKMIIDSRTLSGEYRIERVRYSGDTHANPWYIFGEAIEL
jgi:hypothetical protein